MEIKQFARVWQSYVGRGAPSNAAGERVGYGKTREEASESAGHWHNQAPYERLRRVDLVGAAAERWAELKWGQLELAAEFGDPSERDRAERAQSLIRAGDYQQAAVEWFCRR